MRVPAVAVLTVSLLATPANAGSLEGHAIVIDGDTIEVQDTRVRLLGIDAPEIAQTCRDGSEREFPCGQVAARALAERIGAGVVACDLREPDRYARTLGVCRVEDTDLGGWLVEQGLAVAYRLHGTAYFEAESEARRSGRGLWAGDFMMPWEWRQAAR